MNTPVFISWEKHQRTRTIAKKFSLSLYEVVPPYQGVKRYLFCLWTTLSILVKNKPRVLIVQNPSLILSLWVLVLRPFFGYKLVMDAHNEAIIPFLNNNSLFRFLSKTLTRYANLTLVTNPVLAKIVHDNGGKAFILPDILPQFEYDTKPPQLANEFNITFVCTYAQDEPVQEIFKAAELLGNQYQFKVTGRIPKDFNHATKPANVMLTDFLSEHDYITTLANSHIIIDLTTMDNCLVCGAYEAIALERPLILSANDASLALFGNYAIHTKNSSDAIAEAVLKIYNDYSSQIERNIFEKNRLIKIEEQRVQELLTTLDSNL